MEKIEPTVICIGEPVQRLTDLLRTDRCSNNKSNTLKDALKRVAYAARYRNRNMRQDAISIPSVVTLANLGTKSGNNG